MKPSRLLGLPTQRSWSWAPHTKKREIADFPPLKMLYCGSDAFSVPTFNMLRELHLRRSDIISHLSVITPCDKLSGRGMTVRKPAPMTLLARQMRYPVNHVHEFSLKTSELPEGEWDLIIAVSFGHKITADVLDRMSHGGLNTHPSLLPKYRGPAPLHHALLNDDQATGVSLQTLHPTEFDRGDILKQSEPLPIQGETLSSLSSKTAMMGSTMLRELLLAGYPANSPEPLTTGYESSYAGKITKAEMQIRWSSWTVVKIERWSHVLGSLWSMLGDKVVKVNDVQRLGNENASLEKAAAPGTIQIIQTPDGTDRICAVRAADGWVKIGRLTIAGKKEKPGSEAVELHSNVFSALNE